MLNSITPFFIVEDLAETLRFYEAKLGFQVLYKGGDGQGNDFWAMVGRDKVTLMLKHITPDIHPQPNRRAMRGLPRTLRVCNKITYPVQEGRGWRV
jgi:catechol 2,3-dioxygenase-like lactoylglutathione lyase family enzyme